MPELKAVAQTLYHPKSVFIHTLKRTVNIFLAVQFLESDEIIMLGLPDGQKGFKIGLAACDGRRLHDGKDRAMQSITHVKSKVTTTVQLQFIRQ